MAQIDVLPRALADAAGAVREAVLQVRPVAPSDLGDGGLTAALDVYLGAWSAVPLDDAAEDAARSLLASAHAYADVESLLVPRGVR